MSEQVAEGEVAEVSESPEATPEERAAAIGWREDGELSAEDFIARNEDHKGMLRENYQKLERSFFDVKNELGETRGEIKRLLGMQAAMAERVRKEAYQTAVKELDAKRVQAIEEGDAEGFQEAEQKKRELAQNYRKEIQSEKQNEQKQTQQQALQAAQQTIRENFQANPDLVKSKADQDKWMQEFVWAGKSKNMSVDEAIKHANGVLMPKQGVPGMEGNNGDGKSGGKGWAALPADAKAMYDQWKKEIPSLTKEQWAQEYHAMEG